MGRMRVELSGLIAFVAADDDPKEQRINRLTAVFIDPWSFGLRPHVPILSVDAKLVQWENTSLAPLPKRQLGFDLTGWDVTLRVDGKVTQENLIDLPQAEEPDPEAQGTQRKLASIAKLLDIAAISEGTGFRADLLRNPAQREVLGRLTLDRGQVQSLSNDQGKFEDWKFQSGETIVHEQVATETLVWRFSPGDTVASTLQFFLRSVTDPTKIATIQIACPANTTTTVTINHDCPESECGPHVGRHAAMFYELINDPKRRPVPRPVFTEGGYCPPGRFNI